jgi:hypothetical protein
MEWQARTDRDVDEAKRFLGEIGEGEEKDL